MLEVKLDKHDAVLCAIYAAEIRWHNHSVGAKKHHGQSSSRRFGEIFGDFVLGQLAESALSRHFGIAFEAPVLGDYSSADLGGLCEVKASDHPRSGLLIYESQWNPEQLYTFVRMSGFNASLMGWVFGKDAEKVWTRPPNMDTPCWRVDPAHLEPIETMPMEGRKFVRAR